MCTIYRVPKHGDIRTREQRRETDAVFIARGLERVVVLGE